MTRNNINIDKNIYLIQSMLSNNYDKVKNSLVQMVMLFNLFEKVFLSNKTRDEDKYCIIDRYVIQDENIIHDEYEFFKNRYYINGRFTSEFYSLHLNKNLWGKVGKYFEDNENKLFLLFRIVYQIRNNLYHGYKHICELEKYLECFENINSFLLKFIKNANKKID